MEDNYSIDEILSAVDDLQNFKRNKTKKVSSVSNAKTDNSCLLYTSPSPRDDELSRMPSSA